MIKPSFLEPDDRPTVVGQVFGTPLVVKGWTGLPLIELIAWGILSWVAGRKRPDWSWKERVYAGALTSALMLGSEWCHNFAHTAAAKWIDKPTDAIRIFWGTPLLIYYDINDQTVTPRQHILRALGGPFFNLVMVPVTWFAKHFTRKGSLAHYAAGFALGVNSFISSLSLLPIPGLDGGSLLKWSLVNKGRSPQDADNVVKEVNRFVGCGLAITSGLTIRQHRYWLGAAFAAFAAISLAIGFDFLKEHK